MNNKGNLRSQMWGKLDQLCISKHDLSNWYGSELSTTAQVFFLFHNVFHKYQTGHYNLTSSNTLMIMAILVSITIGYF